MESNYFDFYINGIVEDDTDHIGIFHLLANSDEEIIKEFKFISVHNSNIYDFQLENSNEEFINKIENKLNEIQEYDKNYNFINEINEKFPENLKGEKIKKIFEFISDSRDPFLKNVLIKDLLEENFKSLYKKSNLKLEIKFSLLNPEENIMDIVNENGENQDGEKSSSLIKIKINPVFDPVGGIAVYKVKIGDKINFRVMDSNIDFEKINDFLVKDDNDESKKVFSGNVKSIKRNDESNSIVLTISIGELYIGEVSLQEELKIQVQQSDDDAESFGESDEESGIDEQDEDKIPPFIYGIVGAVTFIVILLMYLLFF
ncbi:MAG: hypothetical protein ACQESP_05450 [Candidatus Muiribacteriota bacterium]